MTEVRLPAPVKATPVTDALNSEIPGAFNLEKATVPGADYWGYIAFTCPHGCGAYHRLPIGLKSKPGKVDGRPTWEWNGNSEAPTLSPSIHHIDHWHGFLKFGYFVQA